MKSDENRTARETALSDAAIDWCVLLNSGAADQADRKAFEEWRGRSAAHEAAAREAEALWMGIGLAGDKVRNDEKKAWRKKVTRRALLGGGAAAITGLVLVERGILGPHLFADHSTRTAERRTVTLPDGSLAHLNAGTALSVDYRDQLRSLTLFQGQAMFSVAPDRARPFVVGAQGGRTRATGTVFDVDIRSRDVVVTVVEGTIAVSAADDMTAAVTADANEQVRYASDGKASAAVSVDAAVETAWRRGKMIFHDRPLGDVVAEVDRYRGGRILIINSSLEELKVSGVFEVDDPESVLRTIEETLSVQVTRLPFVTVFR